MYSEKVMDHFQHPRNVGEIENASGVGTVGNAKCGDIMRIYLDIDENQIIRDVKFKTFGCGAAVATSSIATEMIKGKTVEEAEKLSEEGTLTERLLPIRTVFESLPELHLAGRQQTLFQNGVKLDLARLNEMKTMQGYTGDIRVMGEDDVFLGISVADWENGELKMKKLFSILEG